MALDIIRWSLTAACLAWGLTLSWARFAAARCRAVMQEEIDHWQAEAIRARRTVAQLRQEAVVWSRGRQNGLEDLIALMPLLVAARERLESATESPDEDC